MLQDLDPRLVSALHTKTASIPEMKTFLRAEVLEKWKSEEFDTGSSRVQVAMLSSRIKYLQGHIATHNHDKAALRTLAIFVSRRRKILRYMMRNDYTNYRLCVNELALRPLPVLHSKYPKLKVERTHEQVQLRNSRVKNRVPRGHLGH
jgi:small subunit ribosomal protein S15